MKRTINIDYIAFVYFEGGKCHYQEEEIPHPDKDTLDTLQIMKSHRDFLYLRNILAERISPSIEAKVFYRFCYPYEYNNVLYGDAKFPTLYTEKTLPKHLEEIKKGAQWERNFLNMRYPTESTIQRARELDDIIRDPEKAAKIGLVEDFERWMYARDFSRKHSEVVERYPDCICSHDGHGFLHAKDRDGYFYQLTENITFTFRTNFAYGKSSCFFLNVEYKGIKLLPYSTLVNYYYARIEELINYTRAYDLYRSNWHNALQEILFISNSAIENPEKFVNEWLSIELDKMIVSLEDFMRNPHEKVSALIHHPKYDEGKYLKIRNASTNDIADYEILPNRMDLLCSAEKITSALKFIDSIKQVTEFYQSADGYIRRILVLNNELLEQVADELAIVEDSIYDLQQQIDVLKEKKHAITDSLGAEWNYFVQRHEKFTHVKLDEYCLKHPDIMAAWREAEPLRNELKSLNEKKRDMESYKAQLSRYIVKVLDYWQASLAPSDVVDWSQSMDYKEKMKIYDDCPEQSKLPIKKS